MGCDLDQIQRGYRFALDIHLVRTRLSGSAIAHPIVLSKPIKRTFGIFPVYIFARCGLDRIYDISNLTREHHCSRFRDLIRKNFDQTGIQIKILMLIYFLKQSFEVFFLVLHGIFAIYTLCMQDPFYYNSSVFRICRSINSGCEYIFPTISI